MPNSYQKKTVEKGFTLIELLVVISIIALLSVIVLANLQTARQKALNAAKSETVHQIITALEEYADANNGYYPMPASPAILPTRNCLNADGVSRSQCDVSKSSVADQCIEANSSAGGYCVWGPTYSVPSSGPHGDPTLSNALAPYLSIASLPKDTVTGDGTYNGNPSPYNWGGIAYVCLTATNDADAGGQCQTYALEWIVNGIDTLCDGGVVADPNASLALQGIDLPNGDTKGEGAGNTYCVYTNDSTNGFYHWLNYWY